MKAKLMHFLRDEQGLTTVEYAIAGGLVVQPSSSRSAPWPDGQWRHRGYQHRTGWLIRQPGEQGPSIPCSFGVDLRVRGPGWPVEPCDVSGCVNSDGWCAGSRDR